MPRSVRGTLAYASKRYVGKEVDCSKLEHKPGRFWGVIGRPNLKLGQREVQELNGQQAVGLMRTIRRYRRANTDPKKRRWLRTHHCSAKLYGDVDFWVARLPRLIGPLPEPRKFQPAAETWIGKQRVFPPKQKPLEEVYHDQHVTPEEHQRWMEATRPAWDQVREEVRTFAEAMRGVPDMRKNAGLWIHRTVKDD